LLKDRARVHPFAGNGGSWRKAAVRFEQTDKIRLGAQLSLPLIARFSRNETANVSFSLSQHICNTTIQSY
jgi:hypothetical protein